jgi:hypothetical protein
MTATKVLRRKWKWTVKPQSGERMQPTAQAAGMKYGRESGLEGAKEPFFN